MSDENQLLDFLLADLAWGRRPRAGTSSDVEHFCAPDAVAPASADLPDATAGCAPETADEAFAREIALAREVAIPTCADCCEPLDGREFCSCELSPKGGEEVCEDAEVDALTQPVPPVALPFGKSD